MSASSGRTSRERLSTLAKGPDDRLQSSHALKLLLDSRSRSQDENTCPDCQVNP